MALRQGISSAAGREGLGALLADRMDIPQVERNAMRSLAAVSSGFQGADQLALVEPARE